MPTAKERDAILDQLFRLTQNLAKAAQEGDIDAVGQITQERLPVIERLYAAGDMGLTQEQRRRLQQLRSLDAAAQESVHRLYESLKEQVKESQAKYEGLTKYNYSRFDLSSGRLFDKRR